MSTACPDSAPARDSRGQRPAASQPTPPTAFPQQYRRHACLSPPQQHSRHLYRHRPRPSWQTQDLHSSPAPLTPAPSPPSCSLRTGPPPPPPVLHSAWPHDVTHRHKQRRDGLAHPLQRRSGHRGIVWGGRSHKRGVPGQGGEGGRERGRTPPRDKHRQGPPRRRHAQGGPRRPDAASQATPPRQWSAEPQAQRVAPTVRDTAGGGPCPPRAPPRPNGRRPSQTSGGATIPPPPPHTDPPLTLSPPPPPGSPSPPHTFRVVLAIPPPLAGPKARQVSLQRRLDRLARRGRHRPQ